MLDGGKPTLIATPSRSDKSLQRHYDHVAEIVSASHASLVRRHSCRWCVSCGDHPLHHYDQQRKRSSQITTSNQSTNRHKHDRCDDAISTHCAISSRCRQYGHKTNTHRWVACSRSYCPLRRCISRAQSHPSMARSTFWAFHPDRQRSSARARSTHIQCNDYALRRQRLRSGHHPPPNTSKSNPHCQSQTHIAVRPSNHSRQQLNKLHQCVLSTFAHNGHRSGREGKWWRCFQNQLQQPNTPHQWRTYSTLCQKFQCGGGPPSSLSSRSRCNSHHFLLTQSARNFSVLQTMTQALNKELKLDSNAEAAVASQHRQRSPCRLINRCRSQVRPQWSIRPPSMSFKGRKD